MHNEELHNLHSSPNIIRMIMQRGRDGWAIRMGEMKNSYRIIVGKLKENR
jgi:hypothetical protein